MQRANEKHGTVHITASLLELVKQNTEIFLRQDHFPELCVLIKIRETVIFFFNIQIQNR